jgi:hypothetical protein
MVSQTGLLIKVNVMIFRYIASISAALFLTIVPASAQYITPGAQPGTAYIYSTPGSFTLTLPQGYHSLAYLLTGSGGGSGCGVVEPSGTASSGGGTGGTAAIQQGLISAAFASGGTTVSIVVAAPGSSCIATGTSAGSSGSAATAGSASSFTIGSFSVSAGGGGAGSNGSTAASAGGAGGGGAFSATIGGNASGVTAGSGGCSNNGASGAVISGNTNSYPCGAGGGGTAIGGAANITNMWAVMNVPGTTGPGLAATPVALNGARPTGPNGNMGAVSGSNTCAGTSQNAASGTLSGIPVPGIGGPSGASCTASNGGNGAAGVGFGESGGGGGSAETGFTAGSGGASAGGFVEIVVY